MTDYLYANGEFELEGNPKFTFFKGYTPDEFGYVGEFSIAAFTHAQEKPSKNIWKTLLVNEKTGVVFDYLYWKF